MQIKALSSVAISLSATAVFAVANVAFADNYEIPGNIADISVTVTDSVLDSSDLKTRYTVNDSGELISESFYDIYNYENLTLSVSYISGETASYSGTEIASLTAKTGIPFIISDSQDEQSWTIGTYTVTCIFADKTADITFTVQESEIASLTVTPQQEISFIQGLDGEKRTVISDMDGKAEITEYPLSDQSYIIEIGYKNGNSARYTVSELLRETKHSLKFAQPDGELSAGTHTGSCYVDGVRADFSFSITENPIDKIELYMADDGSTLDFSRDGVTAYDKNNNPYPKFFFKKSLIRAVVTYTDGTAKDLSLSQLCSMLDDRLCFTDNQEKSPYNTNKVTIGASIRNIACALTLDIKTEAVEKLTVTDITPDSAKLSWDRVYCAGYELMQYLDGKWQTVSDIPFGNEKFTVDSLTPSVQYSYGVRSYVFDDKGEKLYTDTTQVQFRTAGIKENITISKNKVTADSITVSWSGAEYAEGFAILLNGKQIATTDSTAKSYTIKEVSSSTAHTVSVKSFVKDQESIIFSGEATLIITTPPCIVRDFKTSSRTTSSVTVKWNKSTDADGYIINRYQNGKWVRIMTTYSADKLSHKIKGLSAGETQKLYIKAFKIIDNKYYFSEPAKLDILSNPAAPGKLTATSNSGSVTLKWNTVSNADGYIVNIYKNGKWVNIAKLSGADKSSYTVKNLNSSTEYNFYIKSYKKYGTSTAYSVPVKITVCTTPKSVVGFNTASRTTSSVTVKWSKSADADGYIINRYQNGKWVRIMTTYSAAKVSHAIKGLSAGETQKLYIKAFKVINGKYYFSSATKIDTLSNPAGVTGLTTLSKSKSTIVLKWNRNEKADGYIVNIYQNGGWKTIKKLDSNKTSHTVIEGLSEKTEYKLYVKAYKSYGKSTAYSAPTKITTSTR